MSCDAQGRCHFCRHKHAVSVLGSDKTAHTLLQKSNLRLVVLNTVCSSCIIKLEDCISRAHIENLMRFTEPNTSIGNLESTKKSQVDENFQIQNTTDINRPISHESVQIEKAEEVGVTRSIDSTNTRYEARVDIDNSQFHENARGTRKKQRRLMCDFCQKEFNHAGDLNKHRRKHTGEKPYTCNECQYKFSHVSNLVRHQRVHSGIRPYSCQTCGRTFTRKDKLSIHLMAKHHKFSKSN